MIVKGTQEVDVDISDEEIIKAIYKKLHLNQEYYIKDSKIYIEEDVGFHKADYEERLVTCDINKVDLLNSIKTIEEAFKNN